MFTITELDQIDRTANFSHGYYASVGSEGLAIKHWAIAEIARYADTETQFTTDQLHTIHAGLSRYIRHNSEQDQYTILTLKVADMINQRIAE